MNVCYNFPLAAQQSGALMGNGVTGEMLWGSGNKLNISLGCADLWDHRGGMEWTEKQNFKDIRAALEADDMEKIKTFFNQEPTDGVRRPSLIPVGRIVLTLPENACLLRYVQEFDSGSTKIFYELDGKEDFLEFFGDFTMKNAISGKGLTPEMAIEVFDAYHLSEISDYPMLLAEHATLREHGFVPPEKFSDGKIFGFIQPMPADKSASLFCCKFDDGTFTVSFDRDLENKGGAKSLEFNSFEAVARSSAEYFANFWQDVPQIKYHVPQLQQVYYHSLFKYAIATNPAGVVPGLQAAWIEDDRLPPWQGDYHFNINVQMCLLPGLKAGKFAHLKKFFDMVLSWKPRMLQNARFFAGIDKGYMLPHAVDDRCTCMGGFWTGTIDHACSAWVAKMMFDYCEYTGDKEYLRNEVYDFMTGVLAVYDAMAEYDAEGKLSLPVTISPEYRGSAPDAWGKNASFQLAACYQLAKNLLLAAKMLETEPDPIAEKIVRDLPKFTMEDGEIALWQGLLLEETHRHHSHLAGIAPFEIIDPLAEDMQEIIDKTMLRWTFKGMGEWTGWCLPWASQLCSRCANGEMAELILKIWQDCFTNAGGGSLHDGRYKGFTIYSKIRGEVMQIDGGMGAITAIQDQFMHVFDGELRLFNGIAQHVRDVAFENMAAPGKLRVSGKITPSGEISASVTAEEEREVKIAIRQNQPFTIRINAGETIVFTVKDGKTLPA